MKQLFRWLDPTVDQVVLRWLYLQALWQFPMSSRNARYGAAQFTREETVRVGVRVEMTVWVLFCTTAASSTWSMSLNTIVYMRYPGQGPPAFPWPDIMTEDDGRMVVEAYRRWRWDTPYSD